LGAKLTGESSFLADPMYKFSKACKDRKLGLAQLTRTKHCVSIIDTQCSS
jgi:hypothetical protein